MYLFENLDIYNKAVGIAAVVEMATQDFPKSTDHFGRRINHSAFLIHRYVAEGHSRFKEEERKDFFWRARTAIQECSGLLEIAANQGLIDLTNRIAFRIKLDTLSTLIQGLIRGSEAEDNQGLSNQYAAPFV